MTKFQLGNKTIKIPSNWDELSTDNFNSIFFHVFSNPKNIELAKIKILFDFIGIDWEVKNFNSLSKSYIENITVMTQFLDFIFSYDNDNDNYIINYTSLINYNSSILNLNSVLKGFQDMSFDEFRFSLDFYTKYVSSNNENDLDLLCASIYRPFKPKLKDEIISVDYDGNKRIPFNINNISQYASIFEKIDIHIKLSIFMFYKNNLNFITTKDIVIGTKKVNFSFIFSQNEDINTETLPTMLSTMYKIAEDKTFGDIKEIGKTNIYDIFLRLYQYEIDYKKQLKEIKKYDKNRRF